MSDKDLKIKISAEVSNAGLTQLKSELANVSKQMDMLRQSGQQGSQAWNDLKVKANVLNTEIKSLNREFKGLDGQVKKTKFQMMEFGENVVTVVRGITDFGKQLFNVGKELVQSGAEYGVYAENFEKISGGSEQAAEKLDLLRKASSGNLDDKSLILYANKMKLLGFNTDDTTKLLDIVERKSDEVGVKFDEGEQKLQAFIMTGRGRGLQELGINIATVDARMKELAIEQGINIKNLSDEELQTLRTKTIIDLFGNSLDKIKTKTKDTADTIASLENATKNAKDEIGNFIANGTVKLIESLGLTSDSAIKTTGYISAIGTITGNILPSISMAALAFKSLGGTITAAGLATTGLVSGLVAIYAALVKIKDKFGLDIFNGNFISNLSNIFTSDFALDYIEENAIEDMQKIEANKIKDKSDPTLKMSQTQMGDKFKKSFDAFNKDVEKNETNKIKRQNTSSNNVKKVKKDSIELAKEEYDYLVATNQATDDNIAKLQMQLILEREKKTDKKRYVELTNAINFYDEKFIEKQKIILEREKLISDEKEKQKKLAKQQSDGIAELFSKGKIKPRDEFNLQGGGTDNNLVAGEKVSAILDVATQTTQILGLGADTFVGKMLSGFNQILGLADSVISLLENFGLNAGSGGIFGLIGEFLGFASGGLFSGYGSGKSDSNLVRLSNGEFVVNAISTKQFLPLLQAINGTKGFTANYAKYASGGMVNRNMNVNNVYLGANMDAFEVVKVGYPKYKKYKYSKRI